MNRNSGKALDINASSHWRGTALQPYTCVAAGHVRKTLVVAERGEHDDGLGAGTDLAPAGVQSVAFLAYQATDDIEVRFDTGSRTW
ncbi:hypothetical protein [Streptomyces sp. NPDC050287]|uniref:hypothetical protein n=1 Tax=Streptomyces sp. NPDC050287 TaxID=3365608 RepID=UPI0037B25A80